jgi:hypothetical protein
MSTDIVYRVIRRGSTNPVGVWPDVVTADNIKDLKLGVV